MSRSSGLARAQVAARSRFAAGTSHDGSYRGRFRGGPTALPGLRFVAESWEIGGKKFRKEKAPQTFRKSDQAARIGAGGHAAPGDMREVRPQPSMRSECFAIERSVVTRRKPHTFWELQVGGSLQARSC